MLLHDLEFLPFREKAVIEQSVLEFDSNYIDYILATIGTGYLHKFSGGRVSGFSFSSGS